MAGGTEFKSIVTALGEMGAQPVYYAHKDDPEPERACDLNALLDPIEFPVEIEGILVVFLVAQTDETVRMYFLFTYKQETASAEFSGHDYLYVRMLCTGINLVAFTLAVFKSDDGEISSESDILDWIWQDGPAKLINKERFIAHLHQRIVGANYHVLHMDRSGGQLDYLDFIDADIRQILPVIVRKIANKIRREGKKK